MGSLRYDSRRLPLNFLFSVFAFTPRRTGDLDFALLYGTFHIDYSYLLC